MIYGKEHSLKGLILAVLILVSSSCSTFQPPDANGPRANAKPYPIEISPVNIPASTSAWQRLVQTSGAKVTTLPNFNRATGTLSGLPPTVSGAIFLPKVGDSAKQTEEETREALRRFITIWQDLIGASLNELSLLERVDDSSGIKLARYEQKPFRYPLRGSFGKLLIKFTSDGKVVDVSSSCIPEVDKLQNALSSLTLPDDRDAVLSKLKGTTFEITDSAGTHKFSVSSDASLELLDLVVYAMPDKNDSSVIDAYLAWEIRWPDGPLRTIYLDAVNEAVIAGN